MNPQSEAFRTWSGPPRYWWFRDRDFIAIVLLAVLAACGYGVIHDQITVRICLEYFTIGHPRIFTTESPTLLAFGWCRRHLVDWFASRSVHCCSGAVG